VIDKLILKEDPKQSKLSKVQQEDIKSVFNIRLTSKEIYNVVPETLDENDSPVIITQSEFMRRMKEMSQLGGGMNFYGELPDSYNLVVNLNHPLVLKIAGELEVQEGTKLKENNSQREKLKEEISFMEKEHGKKKAEEISQFEKDDLEKLKKELETLDSARKDILEAYGSNNKVVKQLIDLALLANNMLRGEDLSTFVKRSVELL
jgi:molecular chaperone HtpG